MAEPLLSVADYFVIMGVDPGFSGQTFLPDTYSKLSSLSQLRNQYGYAYKLMVDGGVDFDIAKRCRKLGADSIVGGMFVCFGQQKSIKECCMQFTEFANSD